jgi:hypothetical protein
VLKAASMVQYSDPGYLVFVNEGVLLGQRYDARGGRVSGRPFSVAERVRYFMSTGAANFATSFGGTLAFQPQDDVHRLAWFDRSGREIGTIGQPSKLLNVFIPGGRSRRSFRPSPRRSRDIRRLVVRRRALSTESGQPEAYVMPFPGPGEKTRVSTGGASVVRWSRDGRELLYLSADRHMVAVPVRTFPLLRLGVPIPLFELKGRSSWPAFDVSTDGTRLLAIVPESIADERPLSVVVNWPSDVEK